MNSSSSGSLKLNQIRPSEDFSNSIEQLATSDKPVILSDGDNNNVQTDLLTTPTTTDKRVDNSHATVNQHQISFAEKGQLKSEDNYRRKRNLTSAKKTPLRIWLRQFRRYFLSRHSCRIGRKGWSCWLSARDMADILCVTGGIVSITGICIICLGVFPKSQVSDH